MMRLLILLLALALAQGRVLLGTGNTTQPWAEVSTDELGSMPTLASAASSFTFRLEVISSDNRTCANFTGDSGQDAFGKGLASVLADAAKSLGMTDLNVTNTTIGCRDPPNRKARTIFRKRLRVEADTSPITDCEAIKLLNEVGTLGIDGGAYQQAVASAGGSGWPLSFFLYLKSNYYSLCINQIKETYCYPKKGWNPASTVAYTPGSS